MRPRLRRAATILLVAAVAASAVVACGADTNDPPPGLDVAAGFAVERVASGFDRPTQLARIDESTFVIGQLAGAENDATGEVVQFDLGDPDVRTVLASGLDKPTGVAVVGDELFVIESTRVTARALAPGASPRIVVDGLVNNGRSQGALTVTDEGSLMFNTSGRRRGGERVAGSATLWELTPGATEAAAFATGFKHAYATEQHDDGRLFAIEMSDGTFDGARAEDELVMVTRGDDAGWPWCVDDNRPVEEFGGSAARCLSSPRSHALFGAGATPTAVVTAPWDPAVLLVSLWIPGTIVTVPTAPGDRPHRGDIIVSGIESPQSLLVDGDRVLIVDHETGDIFSLRPRT